MASSINPNNIDSTYPVAGQDNDSQGFRDNFTNIKSSLTYAKAELEDLQGKVVLKSALSGTTLDNDFAGATITSAKMTDLRLTKSTPLATGGTVTIDINNGGYQTFTMTDATAIEFSNWPAAGQFSKVRVSINITDTLHTVTLPAAVSVGTKGIVGFDGTDTITFPEIGTYDFEFSTADGGSTITLVDLSRSLENVRVNTEELDDAAAASLTVTTSYFVTAGAETATLADGVEGQTKVFVMTADAGDMDIEVASAGWEPTNGTGYIHFSAKGQSCTLQFVSGAWYCVGNNDAVLDTTP